MSGDIQNISVYLLVNSTTDQGLPVWSLEVIDLPPLLVIVIQQFPSSQWTLLLWNHE